jgi:hypothetical protein
MYAFVYIWAVSSLNQFIYPKIKKKFLLRGKNICLEIGHIGYENREFYANSKLW